MAKKKRSSRNDDPFGYREAMRMTTGIIGVGITAKVGLFALDSLNR